jgi:hypothetical protein
MASCAEVFQPFYISLVLRMVVLHIPQHLSGSAGCSRWNARSRPPPASRATNEVKSFLVKISNSHVLSYVRGLKTNVQTGSCVVTYNHEGDSMVKHVLAVTAHTLASSFLKIFSAN